MSCRLLSALAMKKRCECYPGGKCIWADIGLSQARQMFSNTPTITFRDSAPMRKFAIDLQVIRLTCQRRKDLDKRLGTLWNLIRKKDKM